MKVTGIVVEYNPFHNGHRYHLKKAKENGELVIAVMSGDFVQRGEPALINRWRRAEMALRNGVDIVVELPVFYSTQSAEIFSRGAIGILEILKVRNIVFGSESGDVGILEELAALEESEKFKNILKKNLKEGHSYPAAYSMSLDEATENRLVLNSNDILGLEYVKGIKYWKSGIKPIPIKREKVGYHSVETIGDIASATGIREFIEKGIGIEKYVPEESYSVLQEEITNKNICSLENFYPLIRMEILNQRDKLNEIQDMEVGFENRLYEGALKNREYKEFFEYILSKRMTKGRVQRILIHILLGIKKEFTESMKKEIPYVRILGFNEDGRKYLKEIMKTDDRIITSLKNIKKKLDGERKEALEFNEKCSKIYSIINHYEDLKIPVMI